jgi:hypothetical protein
LLETVITANVAALDLDRHIFQLTKDLFQVLVEQFRPQLGTTSKHPL